MLCGNERMFLMRFFSLIRTSSVITAASILSCDLPAWSQTSKEQEQPQRRKTATMEELALALESSQSGKNTPAKLPELPSLPSDVTELRFEEFYKSPVGPRGLEPTEKLLSLNGKRVRLLGHMAAMTLRNNRQFILSPLPLKAQPLEYGQADDIPAAHALVKAPGNPAEKIRHTPGLMLLTGRLSVGARSLDGENAFVRLLLDAPDEKAKDITATEKPSPKR